jgi:hypothetical protein
MVRYQFFTDNYMNKKGIIAVIVIIIIIIVAIMALKGSGTSVSNPNNEGTTTENTTEVPAGVTKDTYAPVTKENTDAALISRLKSASVAATESGAKVALVNGSATFSEGSVKGTLTLGDVAVEKEVSGAKYVVTSLAVNSGGSGTFKYVVIFEDKGNSLTDKSYALVGDRVVITGIRVDTVAGGNGKDLAIVTVDYLDFDKGEPLAGRPTVPHKKIFVAEDGIFNPAKEISL